MGVHPGLTLTESNAICPGLLHFDQEPERDQRAIESLAMDVPLYPARVPADMRKKNQMTKIPKAIASTSTSPVANGSITASEISRTKYKSANPIAA